MGKINGVDLSLFGGNNEKRRAAKRKFAAELYLSASFFGQKRVTPGDENTPLAELDVRINTESGAKVPMAHPAVKTHYIPERDPATKIKAAVFVAPAVSTCNFDIDPNLIQPKPAKKPVSVLKTVPIDGRFYIQGPGRKWWRFSYETQGRADSCRVILQENWHDAKKKKDDLTNRFLTSFQEIREAAL